MLDPFIYTEDPPTYTKYLPYKWAIAERRMGA